MIKVLSSTSITTLVLIPVDTSFIHLVGAYTSTMEFSISGTFLVSLVVFYIVYKIVGQFRSRMPPGPIGIPLIGNFFTLAGSYLRSEHPHDLMTRLSCSYGKVFSLGFGGRDRLVVLNDFASVAEAFKNPDVTERPPTDVIRKGIGADGKEDYNCQEQ